MNLFTFNYSKKTKQVDKAQLIRRSSFFTDSFYDSNDHMNFDFVFRSHSVEAFIDYLCGTNITLRKEILHDLYFLTFQYGFHDFHNEIFKTLLPKFTGKKILKYLEFGALNSCLPSTLIELVSDSILSLSQLNDFVRLPLDIIEKLIVDKLSDFSSSQLLEISTSLYISKGEEALSFLKFCDFKKCDDISLQAFFNILPSDSIYFKLLEALLVERKFHKKFEGKCKHYSKSLLDHCLGEPNDAYFLVGKMFEKGAGVEKDKNKALEMFTEGAIEEIDPRSAYHAGYLLEENEDYPKAIKYLKIAIKNGNDKIKLKVINRILRNPELYSLGKRTVSQNYDIIESFVEEENNPDAYFAYAIVLRDGLCCRRDLLYSIQYLMKVKELEIETEQNIDAEIQAIKELDETIEKADEAYDKGCYLYNLSQQHHEEAAELFKLAADAGNVNAMIAFADRLKKGDGVDCSLTESAKYYKLAADKGNAHAQCNYGYALLRGIGVEVDIDGAAKYFKMSAEGNDIHGIINYGSALRLGRGTPQNLQLAAKYLKLGADCGEPHGQNAYGLLLMSGEGIEKNTEEAAKYFKMACDGGNVFAMINYANLLYKGDGVQKDKVEARKYLKDAAESGEISAQIAYANHLLLINEEEEENETDLNEYEINVIEAIKYLELAARKGSIEASLTLAKLFDGKGTERNETKRAEFLQIAADLENTEAQVLFAKMLIDGIGIEKNIEFAMDYLIKACEKENEEAKLLYENLVNQNELIIE
ncbi:hypothetical protein TRFO_18875 [Tritrichomonas foetus]|uniref:Uncharacterized protein n=1 Tax=Tritrichomonas foetus TaxID=1144522 RepID=A0A1J4KJY2_9EUKA|nr:hypothetical protein TRFO_18875 [Tritrichomonas foetus]|eukprot:OHT11615.1 hypothetical protein TRFO_18875 [Tritrichomonas foetus]